MSPNACGDIKGVDIGRRIHAFLDASARLEGAVKGMEMSVAGSCKKMGTELGMDKAALSGDTGAVCDAVAAKIKESLKVGLKADAKLTIDYQPAVCTVDASIAANAAAECEAKASADVQVTCSGSCSGTCSGTCNGECSGSTGTGGSGGQCDGTCNGTCEGQCSGGCEGSADVQAEATCKASAEVRANADVKCTEPKLDISYDASVVADASSVERAVNALKVGLPELLVVKAKATGPVTSAVTVWAKTAKNLAAGGASQLNALGAKAMCVSGQLAAAAKASAQIQASVSVSVSASASVGGSAGM